MDEPKEFQLLNDSDGIFESKNSSYPKPVAATATPLNKPSRPMKPNFHMSSNNKKQSPQAPVPLLPRSSQNSNRPTGFKFKISPNNPDANVAKRDELKSIARPRSRTGSRSSLDQMGGIEDYIQFYANNVENTNKQHSSSQSQLDKITMNLKMDDLLSNVKNENNSYQMLSDFSFLHGDSDAIGSENQMYSIKKGKRTRSLENTNLSDTEWMSTRINDLNELNNNASKQNNNDDDSDSFIDTKTCNTDETNLEYKYTASYRKDETGLFQEESKISFESKMDRNLNRSNNQRAVGNDDEPELDEEAKQAAKRQIQEALNALRGNSEHLESKLDNIEKIADLVTPYVYDPAVDGPTDMSIPLPKSINKLRADPKISNLESNITTGISLIKTFISDDSKTHPTPTLQQATIQTTNATMATPVDHKKSNDLFFNDFLSKSDNLLAQTQSKLERLEKLDSIRNPYVQSPVEQKPPKPIPTATVINRPESPQAKSSATITTNHKSTNLLGMSTSQTSINNSSSLIDLKSQEEAQPEATSTDTGNKMVEQATHQVDLLFDMTDQSLGFELSDTTIKQNASYCDLLGLQSSEVTESIENTNPFPKELLSLNDNVPYSNSNASISNEYKDNLLEDMLGSMEIIENPKQSNFSTPKSKVNEIIGLYSSSDMTKKNSFYENMTAINEADEPLPSPLFSAQEVDVSLQPSIDILITEPSNEMNDSNIVPDGMFDMKHEIPNEALRAQSPGNQSIFSFTGTPAASNSSLNKFNFDPLATVSQTDMTSMQEVSETAKIEPISLSTAAAPASIIRSRPVTPKLPEPLVTPKTMLGADTSDAELVMSELENHSISETKSPMNARKTNKIKIKSYRTSSITGEHASESSSSSDDDDNPKFQIRIRPKSQRKSSDQKGDGIGGSNTVPLLPRPPKTVQEIDEFRQRRMSSGAESMTKSMFGSNISDSDDDLMKLPDSEKPVTAETKPKLRKASSTRKESIQSEYNLELPDEDDLAPLGDFNEKCQLTQYPDGSYGCMLLVRQPFPNANLMYKNVLAKMTEVRTWTECLVKLIDSGPSRKRLSFYNFHELKTIATEHEMSLEDCIAKVVVNTDTEVSKPVPTARDFYRDDQEADKADSEIAEERTLPRVFPFHEIELKASYKFSDLALQQMDVFSKIHTFKIQEIIFKETLTLRQDRIMALPERFMKRFTKPKAGSLIDHTPIPFEIVKFGHTDHSHLKSFLLLLQDAFWQLPTITRKLQREQQLSQIASAPITAVGSITAAASTIFSFGSQKQVTNPTLNSVVSSHAQEQITIKVVDEYHVKLDKECRILEHKSRTRVFLITFLNAPDPIIEIGLNDCLRHGKEIVGRHDIIPIKTEQWISPETFELNENVVDKDEFTKTHCLKCEEMPDNLLVEIMRYRTRPRRNYELPLQVQCFMSLVGRVCEIRIECTVAGTYYTKLNEVHCSDIQIRFPLPDAWVYLFRVEKMFRYGAVHSTKHKFGKIKGFDRLKVHKTQHQGAIMEASCGTAKYEQAFKSLVWRIDQLPVKNKDIYKTHLFICKLNLQEYDNMPDNYDQISQAEYSVVKTCASSKSQVRSISVNTCEDPPEKWVKLKSKFEYDLNINYSFDQQTLPAVDLEKCAELQHLQTESDMDNTEDDVTSDKE